MRGLSDIYIFNSRAVEEKYKKFLPGHKFKIVYEGYIAKQQLNGKNNIKSVLKNQNGYIRCLMVGTLQEGKGHKDAIKSLGELKNKGTNTVLDIVGEGFDNNYKDELNFMISKYGLEENVFFYGFMDDPFPFINNCDIFLMCSRKEAFGMVTIEAMQAGKPVIGAKTGGTKELIIDEFNGLFYSPGDSSELAEKIKYLVQNPNLLKRMGQNGKKWASERFTFDRVEEEMFKILNQLKI
jgi:glycosyltransferase involved in cell wall biosynthesis